MEDIFEALIGALYLDVNYDDEELEHPTGILELYSGYGFHVCQAYIINVIEKLVDFSDLILHDYNYKDKLNAKKYESPRKFKKRSNQKKY